MPLSKPQRKEVIKILRFSKQKFLDRLESEDMDSHISKEDMKILNEIDGVVVSESVFAHHILFEEFMYARGKDGIGYYVRKEDCNEV